MANPNIDDATRARAMKFVADKAAPAAKPRVVSKKELEASGMSLRDFLNKERGLTRRKEADPTLGEAKDKAAQEAADRIDPGDDGGKSVVDRQDREMAQQAKIGARIAELTRNARPRTDAALPKEDTMYKRGGKVQKYAKGGSIDGIAQRGKTRGKMC